MPISPEGEVVLSVGGPGGPIPGSAETGSFSPWAGANYPVYPSSSPFYAFSAETGYGGGDASLSSLSNAGYGGGYFDTGSGLGGGPSLQSFVPGMDAVPDSLIFNPDAVPTSPGFFGGSGDSFGPTSSADFTPVQFGGRSNQYTPWSATQLNPFPEGAPASWSRFAPYVGGNIFAGGLLGALNREAFFGLPIYATGGSSVQFTGGVFGGETDYVHMMAAQYASPDIFTNLTLGGANAPTWVIERSLSGVGPRPNELYPPIPFPPVPDMEDYHGPWIPVPTQPYPLPE